MNDAGITRAAGCGEHEIRTSVAVSAATTAAGAYDATVRYYRDIPQWTAGFAVMTLANVRS